ncbi:MAG: shikimate kinase [Bernardetiaceae bacterium]
MNASVYMIGMPASGKSTWGKKLAMAWRWPFIDLDQVIEKNAGMSIVKIFRQYGEAYFRELEREALHNTRLVKQTVIATGGGAPCFFDNMDFIKNHGVSVFLDTPMSVLIERLESKSNNRPLFSNQSSETGLLQKNLDEKLAQRYPFYAQAHLRLHEPSLTLSDLSAAIRLWAYSQGKGTLIH